MRHRSHEPLGRNHAAVAVWVAQVKFLGAPGYLAVFVREYELSSVSVDGFNSWEYVARADEKRGVPNVSGCVS